MISRLHGLIVKMAGMGLAVLVSAGIVCAEPVLEVVLTAGDYYTVTAQDSVDANIQYWQIKVDLVTGGIYSFKDLTDAGDGSGGHTSYLDTDAYGRQNTLVFFDGRGGNIFTRSNPVAELASHLTFAAAPDGSSFTIEYKEDGTTTDFFHDSYSAGSSTLTPGDLMTTATLVIRPPSVEGTVWDFQLDYENVSDHELSGKVWAAQWLFGCIDEDVVKTGDWEDSLADGPYNPSNLISYGRWTIGANPGLGLTEGRTFMYDLQTGLGGNDAGGGVTLTNWAGFDRLRYTAPFSYGTNMAIGELRTHAGQVIINIAADTGGIPVAHAGFDQTATDEDDTGAEDITLNGGNSFDTGGTIVSYSWSEGGSEIATGVTPTVSLAVGDHTITLTVTDDEGNTDSDDVSVTIYPAGVAAIYYIDFEGGSDNNSGLSPDDAWQHVPGDPNATGIAGGTTFNPGEKIIFKGGVVYYGTFDIFADGTAEDRLVFDGNTEGTFGTGRAIIDGSAEINGWVPCASAADCGGAAQWANMYKTTMPAGIDMFAANFFQGDTRLLIAQDPNPVDTMYYDEIADFFVAPVGTITNSTITSSVVFDQAEANFWDGSYIYIWHNPNRTSVKAITGFDPATDTISYDPLTEPAGIYPDRDSYYSTVNHVSLMDQPGEFVVDDATGTIYLYPAADLAAEKVTYSVLKVGIDLHDADYVTIQGFCVRKFAGALGEYREGVGIRAIGAYGDGSQNIEILDNEIAYNRSMEGKGAIFTEQSHDSLYENNYIHDNAKCKGVLITGATNGMFRNNLVSHNGGTAIDYYTMHDSFIVGNTVIEHTGTHANGITLYLNCQRTLVFGNKVFDGQVALTSQESSDLTFAYNIFSSPEDAYTVAHWGGSGDPSFNLHYYNNIIVNDFNTGITVSDVAQVGIEIKNNIIDGCLVNTPGPNISNNIYTSLAWNQVAGRGWSLGTGEMVETDKSLIFVDAANRDYHLIEGSPAIDGGVDLGFTEDIEGSAVPSGLLPDIGAYEFGAGAAVVGMQVFYNNSVFDGYDPAANAGDDAAIATDKTALLGGETATFANYTSYSRGINGVMVDLQNANTPGSLDASDFEFRVGSPGNWAAAPAPVSVSTRSGAGALGSARVTIVFADGSITKKWLEVKVLANAKTGLTSDKVFYFGNAVGETGNSISDAIVDATDEVGCRNNPKNFMRPAGIEDVYDINRDGKVDATDEILARNNGTSFADDLELITP